MSHFPADACFAMYESRIRRTEMSRFFKKLGFYSRVGDVSLKPYQISKNKNALKVYSAQSKNFLLTNFLLNYEFRGWMIFIVFLYKTGGYGGQGLSEEYLIYVYYAFDNFLRLTFLRGIKQCL